MAAFNELLEKFHEIAGSPKKQLDSYLAQGKKVVACVIPWGLFQWEHGEEI